MPDITGVSPTSAIYNPGSTSVSIVDALKRNDEVAVREWLSQPGTNPNARLEGNKAAIHFAVDHYDDSPSSRRILEMLLADSRVNVNMEEGYYGYGPLVKAIRGRKIGAARLLIECERTNVNAKTDRTPLTLAAAKGSLAVVKMLLQRRDIRVNDLGSMGMSALDWALHNNADVQVAMALIEDPRLWVTGYNFYFENLCDKRNLFPLFEAFVNRADFDANRRVLWSRDPGGKRMEPIALAALFGNGPAAARLIELGAVWRGSTSDGDDNGPLPLGLGSLLAKLEEEDSPDLELIREAVTREVVEKKLFAKMALVQSAFRDKLRTTNPLYRPGDDGCPIQGAMMRALLRDDQAIQVGDAGALQFRLSDSARAMANWRLDVSDSEDG